MKEFVDVNMNFREIARNRNGIQEHFTQQGKKNKPVQRINRD